MNKLLQLKILEKEVLETLNNIQKENDIYITYHSHYLLPTISIYAEATNESSEVMIDGITYKISNDLSISIALKTIQDIKDKLCLN